MLIKSSSRSILFDNNSLSRGQGSHVCGTIVGSCRDNSTSSMNGIAPASKISFFDIGDKNGNLQVGKLTDVFNVAYNTGARVHSNSWGGSNELYGEMDQEVDQYMYDHPDFLVLFAAGNSGEDGLSSVGSPGKSKSCVTVGSTTVRLDPDDQLSSQSTVSYFSSLGPTPDGRFVYFFSFVISF